MQAKDRIQELEEEITTQMQLADTSKGKGHDSKAGLGQAQTQLAKVKADIQRLEMEKERIIGSMAKLDVASEEVKAQPVVAPSTPKPTPASAKSRKSQKGKK